MAKDVREYIDPVASTGAKVGIPVAHGVVTRAPDAPTVKSPNQLGQEMLVQFGAMAAHMAPDVAAHLATGSAYTKAPTDENNMSDEEYWNAYGITKEEAARQGYQNLDEESIDTFNKVKQARLQGLMSPMEARAHVNALIQKKGLGIGPMERAVRRAAGEFFGDLGPGEGLINPPEETASQKILKSVATEAAKLGFISEQELKTGDALNSPGVGSYLAYRQANTARQVEQQQIDLQIKQREFTQQQGNDLANRLFNIQQFNTTQAIYDDLYPVITQAITAIESDPTISNQDAMREVKRTIEAHKRNQLAVLSAARATYAEKGVVQDVAEAQRQDATIAAMYKDLEEAADVNTVNTLLKQHKENMENQLKLGVLNTEAGAALFAIDYAAPGSMREYMKFAPRIQALLKDPAQLENLKKLYPESVYIFDLFSKMGDTNKFGSELLNMAVTGERTGNKALDYMADSIATGIAYDETNKITSEALQNPNSAQSKAVEYLKNQTITRDNVNLYSSRKSKKFVAENPKVQKQLASVVGNATAPNRIQSFIEGNSISNQRIVLDQAGNLKVESTPGGSPYVDKQETAQETQLYVDQLNAISDVVRNHWAVLPDNVKMGEPDANSFIQNHIVLPAVQAIGQRKDSIQMRMSQLQGNQAGDGALYGLQLPEDSKQRTVVWTGQDNAGYPVFEDTNTGEIILSKDGRHRGLREQMFGLDKKYKYYDPADLD